jgi:ABC-type nitrate/sulfonate/bicarbonate transport system substrate-binding protein
MLAPRCAPWRLKTQRGMLALLVALLVALLSTGAAHALEAVKLQLKWRPQFQFAGYYVAAEQGFYREAGLDVTILPGGPNIDAIAAVVDGRAEFGVGSSGALVDRARGRPVVVLAAIFQHSPAILLAPRRPGEASALQAMQNHGTAAAIRRG